MKCKVWISSRCQWKIKQRGEQNSPWRRHWLFIVLSVCSSQTPKTRPVIRPAFFLHTAYSWLNTPVLQLHSHTQRRPPSFSGLGWRQVSGSETPPAFCTLINSLRWKRDNWTVPKHKNHSLPAVWKAQQFGGLGKGCGALTGFNDGVT